MNIIIYIFKSHHYPLKTCKAKFAVGLIWLLEQSKSELHMNCSSQEIFFKMCLFLPPFVYLIEKVYKKMYIIDTDSNLLLECELQ